MKSNFAVLFNLFVAVLCFAAFNSCNSGVDVIEQPTDLEVQVRIRKDKSEIKPQGVIVALFDDLVKYNNAIKTFTTKDAVDTAYTKLGKVTFKNLNPKKTYFLYSLVKDSTTIAKQKIYYDNNYSAFELKKGLNKSSFTVVTIFLDPAESFVKFYAPSNLADRIPIKVFFASDSIGLLSQTILPSNNPDSLFQKNTLTIKIRRGKYPYIISNKIGCSSINETLLDGGVVLDFPVPSCVAGKVSFTANRLNVPYLPITISLDNRANVIGSITQIGSSTSVCDDKNNLNYVLLPGKYNYFAETQIGKCAWKDSFLIKDNECTLITIDKCN